MAKSFFERLTGSIRIQDDRVAPVASRAEAVIMPLDKKTSKTAEKSVKLKREDPSVSEYGMSYGARLVHTSVSSSSGMGGARLSDRHEFSHPVVAADPEPEPEEPEPMPTEEPEEVGELTLDIFDDGSHIVAQAMVAGVRPDDIDISVADNTLMVTGQRKRPHDVNTANYYANELYWGKFTRSVLLPEEIDHDHVEAGLKHGLLTIRLPKKDKNARKIKVRME